MLTSIALFLSTKSCYTLKIVSLNFTLTPTEKQPRKQSILSKLMVLWRFPQGLGPTPLITESLGSVAVPSPMGFLWNPTGLVKPYCQLEPEDDNVVTKEGSFLILTSCKQHGSFDPYPISQTSQHIVILIS